MSPHSLSPEQRRDLIRFLLELAEMDGAWSRLTAKEQAELSAQPARSLLSDGKLATRKVVDEDVWTNRDRSTRRKEVA